MERLRAYLLSSVLLGAVVLPAFRDPTVDGYPFSTYPMFSNRLGRTNAVTSAVAIAADASEVKVPPAYVANAETMQAFYTLVRAVRAGQQESEELCQVIARRLPEASDQALARAVRVELVTESVDAIDYLAGRARPFDRRVHASCPVPREVAK
ncbi:MAG: hypothetical protein RL701_568 [Pseudomonadota bacterium]